jgi:hypothetical protein
MSVESDKQAYLARTPANISLQVNNDEDKPATGSFSASVINESEMPFSEDDDNTIFSDLLLTSELKADQNTIDENLKVYLNHEKLYQQQLMYGMNKGSIMLKEVDIKRKKSAIPRTPPGVKVIFMKNLPKRGVTLISYLDGALPGVMFQNGIPYSTSSHTGQYNQIPVYIDGLPAEEGALNGLTPETVNSVVYGGAIMIYSQSNDGSRQPDIANYTPGGLYKAREFYAPKYDNPSEKSIPNDLRTTVYWNPNIITGKDGKASLHYFNADTKGTYKVTIEGMDIDGNLYRQVQRYTVE